MKQKKLLLAGSHAGATAVALIRQIRLRKLPWEITWIGKKWATEDKKSYTLEYNSLPKLRVKFIPVESGRIQTKYTGYTIAALLKIPLGFIVSGYHVARIRPDTILSFGGAAGAEVSFWGWVFGIPVIVHEQTSVAGRANLFASRFAKVVALSRESSKDYFKNEKVVVTGNPINSEIASLHTSPKKSPETIFITGGSRGSQRINEAVGEILPDLLKRFKIIHQVGMGNLNDYKNVPANYKVYGQIEPDNWANILSQADIVVSRAGANIVSELIALKKPCVLIPIPWVYKNEQTLNARSAKDFGIARILPQDDLTGESLLKEIDEIAKNYSQITESVQNKVSPDINATQNLTDLISEYL